MSESKSIKSGVYIIRCTVNGRVYVGSSIDMKRREWQHRRDLALGKHLSHHLQRAWNKYGTDAFEWSVLENVEINGLTTEEARSLLLGREQHHIEAFDSARRGFKTLPKAGSPLGVKASPETRAKISAALRGKPKSPEARAKCGAFWRGKKQSPEHRAKNATGNRGRKRSAETRAEIGAAHQGQKRGPMSEEWKSKIGAASRGHTVSDESRAKNAAALRGRTRSPEHCANIAAAKRGKKQSLEVVAKRVNANRGQKRSEEVRAKMSAAQREAWQRRKKARGKLVQGWLFDALVERA